MRLALSIAWRFLVTSRGQTALIALGIAVGIAVQVFIGSLITGLQKSLVDRTIGRSSHVTVLPGERGGRIADYRSVVGAVEATEGVLRASAAADAAGFMRVGGETFPVLARGFDLANADGIYRFEEALTAGSLPGGGEVIVGRDLADEAGVGPGDRVELLTPLGQSREAEISGVYDLKVATVNKSWVIAEMPLVQDLFGYGDEATSVEAQVAEVFDADAVAAAVAMEISAEYRVDNWKAQNESLLSGLSGQSISSLMIQIFVLVSVVLGIASVLAITVLQKSRQIGILKAMGIRNGTASLIFLFQGLFLGAAGAALGVLMGLGLSYAFTRFALNADGTPVVALFIEPGFIAASGLVGVLSATLAALVPARRSARLDPMEVIRNG